MENATAAAPVELQHALRTTRTYAARSGAESLLKKATASLSPFETNGLPVEYVIAVNEAGRHAPVVYQRRGQRLTNLCHLGITVIG